MTWQRAFTPCWASPSALSPSPHKGNMMQPFSKSLTDIAESVIRAAQAKKIRIVTAESCTGGLITACLTEISGASDVLDRGFIPYSYELKIDELNVSRRTILDTGAVSAATAMEMAEGAL